MRVAVITGGGSGVGRSVAEALAKEDYAVVLAGRRQEALDTVKASIEELGGRAIAIQADVTLEDDVASLFESAVDAFGRVDLLFNNAGTFGPAALLEEVSADEWRAVVEVNLTGAFLCTQAAFRAMKNQSPRGGRIINNGSISAQTPRPNSAPYTATKHAITGLTKSASLDGRKYDIACGQIDIGNASTNMTAGMKKGVPQADGSLKMEPTMDVENVAKAVVYMASLPLDANVLSMTVMTTKMPFVGRG
ncbi:MAG: 3-oxoacyl-ACP reductase [Opitutales bacterium TMED158]|nr:MAG: 3-oxoacyl-ACP reductase [Opitutales bacterium TMED158]